MFADEFGLEVAHVVPNPYSFIVPEKCTSKEKCIEVTAMPVAHGDIHECGERFLGRVKPYDHYQSA